MSAEAAVFHASHGRHDGGHQLADVFRDMSVFNHCRDRAALARARTTTSGIAQMFGPHSMVPISSVLATPSGPHAPQRHRPRPRVENDFDRNPGIGAGKDRGKRMLAAGAVSMPPGGVLMWSNCCPADVLGYCLP